MSTSTKEQLAAIEARASAVADAFDNDVPLELDTYVWKYAPGQQKRFTSIRGEQGEIAAVEGWEPDEQAAITALIDAVTVTREDVPALLAAVRERDNTIARVRAVGLLGLDKIAQKSIDATVARMQDQLGCTPDDLGPDVMSKIVDSHIEQAELLAGPVLDALRAALDPTGDSNG